ncbi:DMT family transporter [Alicyclobacillus macrosporangiidus]|uniref:Permease of the drug/metabolite transporter (DMT) superfamily n=1 Tax=Alicyclobacillus macrosporangiidus TaxID=392015 RepID=A0A1I7GXX0_9BACL|nr:DMT family transporter [Alicyclobacillus macrosporangiidus]SFU53304.1 Permease of the drug/metabolite transporter (DMT) superfamily [Alicyclobacillus macrosporangiidus]
MRDTGQTIGQTTAALPTSAPAKGIRGRRTSGIARVLIAATLWGVSGTAAQQLFQSEGFTPGWLVTVRMGVSGVILLLLSLAAGGTRRVFSIWTDPRGRWQIVVFALFGLASVQYTYFAAIQAGNAATATFLQYLGPVLVVLYGALRQRRPPNRRESLATLLAVFGTFLLVTGGSTARLSVSPAAAIWGFLSAVTLAIYTIYPGPLMARWGPATVIGWGMTIGSLACAIGRTPWDLDGQIWSVWAGVLVAFVVIGGTLVAFYLYLTSQRYISPAETSLLACAEPLSAALAAVVWLHTPLSLGEIAGGLCIVATVAVLARGNRSAGGGR